MTLVDLKGFKGVTSATLAVANIPLPSLAGLAGFSSGRTDDIARLAVDNTPNTLEPESVAFSEDSRFAYVTLQENNGVVRLNLQTGELTFFGLGMTAHLGRSHQRRRVCAHSRTCWRFGNPTASHSIRPAASSSPPTRAIRVTARAARVRAAGVRSASLIPPLVSLLGETGYSSTMPRRRWASIRTTAATAAARNRKSWTSRTIAG